MHYIFCNSYPVQGLLGGGVGPYPATEGDLVRLLACHRER